MDTGCGNTSQTCCCHSSRCYRDNGPPGTAPLICVPSVSRRILHVSGRCSRLISSARLIKKSQLTADAHGGSNVLQLQWRDPATTQWRVTKPIQAQSNHNPSHQNLVREPRERDTEKRRCVSRPSDCLGVCFWSAFKCSRQICAADADSRFWSAAAFMDCS